MPNDQCGMGNAESNDRIPHSAFRTPHVLILLGCGLRLFHFFRDPSVWHDEAALIVNVLRNDFARLLGPLQWNEAAPPLFLWLERAMATTLGDSTFALRMVPVMASCLAMILVGQIAFRRLPTRGAFWATLLFAVSDRLLWHASEAKPYAVDVLLAAVVLRAWPLTFPKQIALIVLTPTFVFLSYPACFILGGLWLASWPTLARWMEPTDSLAHRSRKREAVAHWTWAVVLVGSFAALYFGPIRAQRTGSMESCWTGHFPNWSRPWSTPIWSLANCFEVMRYNFQPWGNLLGGLALVGVVAWWRRGERRWLLALLAPLALAWFAALIGGYPFGGSRLEVFTAPALALLLGAGIEPVRQWLLGYSRWAYAPIVGLLLVPLLWTGRHLIDPWPRADAAGAAEFVLEHHRTGEPILANHWEYDYYCRDRAIDLKPLDARLPSATGRKWVVITAPDKRIRDELTNPFAAELILTRREFDHTTVLLVDGRGGR